MLRFAGFELDQQRATLRGPDGAAIKLRPKTFEMLRLFAANAGRILSKQELMEAVWPNVHVGEDSLFQCIREIRTALGDDQRQMIKLVSGRGYLFDAEVSNVAAQPADQAEAAVRAEAAALLAEPAHAAPMARTEAAAGLAQPRRLFGLRGPVAIAAAAGLCMIIGLAVAAPVFGPGLLFKRTPPVIAVMPIVGASDDPQVAPMAANVTDRLTDGLTKIDNIRVVAPPSGVSPQPASAQAVQADLVLSAELKKAERSWELRARLTSNATREVEWTTSVSVAIDDADTELQQSRLTAGLGHRLAVQINARLHAGTLPGNAKVAVEQAKASINQTTRERFTDAQAMLEKALADNPENVDVQVALAAHLMRGVQMVWYNEANSAAAESNARALLERALRARPNYIPTLEAYCRFLSATNQFVESLVTCATTLSFDPWNGLALYHVGLAQMRLGRFEDALSTFRLADRFDTPEVSRWTWLVGAGWTNLLMGRNEDALPWLQRSIAITPASGRTYFLLAVAYQRLGRTSEANAAFAKAMALRPGSTAVNVEPPLRNSSPVFLEASNRIMRSMIEIGLPER